MRMARAAVALAAAVSLLLAAVASAQPEADTTFPLGQPSPILTLDQERLFEDSAFGQRVRDEVEEAARALAAENRRLEEELSDEELALTERRAELAPEEFRELADAFDARVAEIRATQESKNRALSEFQEAETQRFFSLIAPILTAMVRERGAVALLDRRAIFIAADRIDVTDAAIARADAEIGTGADTAPPILPDEPEPAEAPDAAPPPAEGGPPLELPDPITTE